LLQVGGYLGEKNCEVRVYYFEADCVIYMEELSKLSTGLFDWFADQMTIKTFYYAPAFYWALGFYGSESAFTGDSRSCFVSALPCLLRSQS
jgi:hypothetical protein